MGEVRRVIDWMDSHRAVSFDVDEDLVGGCAYDAHGVPLTDETMAEGARRRRRAASARSAGRSGTSCRSHPSPSAACCACARTWTCSPTCARRSCFDALADASTLKRELVAGPRHHDRPRADRRRLFRRAARHRDAARRRAHAASTPRSTPLRDPSASRRVAFELARKRRPRDLGREGQRDGIRRAVARGGRQAPRCRIPRRRACPHVRRQLRHAAGARAQAVRRDRHRQPVRRHPVGRAPRC